MVSWCERKTANASLIRTYVFGLFLDCLTIISRHGVRNVRANGESARIGGTIRYKFSSIKEKQPKLLTNRLNNSYILVGRMLHARSFVKQPGARNPQMVPFEQIKNFYPFWNI